MSIEVQGLSFGYGETEVLHDVSFHAGDKEVTVIIGSNGAGKTTLLRCILGLLPWKQGSITVGGSDIKGWSHRESARIMAYVPQMCAPSFNFTCIDMVMMGANNRTSLFANPGEKEEEFATECMDSLGISHLRERLFFDISGGERQLVLIARALMQKTKALLLDEPVANLDYGNQIRVMEEIGRLAEKGYCVVLTSHNPEQTYLYADKVAAFAKGKLLVQGTPQKVITEETIRTLYGVDISIESILGDRMRVCVPGHIIKEEVEKCKEKEVF
jgi:iron complex transport system ATP-binding protein